MREPDAPRAIAASERAAVEIAVAYARQGPEAIWERLAADDPWRELGRERALAEIETRLGPREGAIWELETASRGAAELFFSIRFPSGQDEIVALELGPAPDFRIRSLRTLVDPVAAAPGGTPVAAILAEPAERRRAGGSEPGPVWAVFVVGLVAVAAVAALAGARNLRRAAAGALLLSFVGLSCGRATSSSDAAAEAKRERTSLGELQAARRAFALGESAPRLDTTGMSAAAQRIVELWRAELLVLEGAYGEVATILGQRVAGEPPLAELLRARHAAFRFRGDEAPTHYENVRAAGFTGDGLAYEQALIEALFAKGGPGPIPISGLIAMGSRRSEAWYEAARASAIDEQLEEGERRLRVAWQHDPMPREDLFDDSVLAFLAARATIFPLFEPGSPHEPKVEPAVGAAATPLASGPAAVRCGQRLRLTVGADNPMTIEVPGGAVLAPAGTRSIDAVELRRLDEVRALREIRRKLGPAENEQIDASPRLQRQLEIALPPLRRERRWAEIEALTRPLAGGLARLDPQIVRARASALVRMDREAEALALLLEFAKHQMQAKRPEPGTLYDLAELLSRQGDYAHAIQLVQKADGQLRLPVGERRLRIFRLAQELHTDAVLQRTDLFDIRSPRGAGEIYPKDLGRVLEIERERISRYVPLSRPKRIEVELFPLEGFLNAFGGDVAVIGIFDGRLRVPLADVQTLRPEVVALVSHELLHALLSQASRDGAPHWFQEGLAQWIETGTVFVNPFPDLERRGHTLSFPLLELVLQGFAEPSLVELAYSESLWSVAFLESRWGERGIRALVQSFASGASTEEAIKALTGLELAGFDRELRRWATEKAPPRRHLEPRRFDRMEGALFERGSKRERSEIEPLVGTSGGRKPGYTADRAGMEAWHVAYRQASAAVRQAYAPIVKVYSSGTGIPLSGDCRGLERALYALRADATALDAPDPAVKASLRALFDAMSRMSSACVEGRSGAARTGYEQVGRAMAEAGMRLQPYGLAP